MANGELKKTGGKSEAETSRFIVLGLSLVSDN